MNENDVLSLNNGLNKLKEEFNNCSAKIFDTSVWSGDAADNAKMLSNTNVVKKIEEVETKTKNLNKIIELCSECNSIKSKIDISQDESEKTTLENKYNELVIQIKSLIK